MDDDQIFSTGMHSLSLVLWVAGVLAVGFLVVLFIDSRRRKRRRRLARAKLRGESDSRDSRSNPLSRSFYRARHSWRKVKGALASSRRTRSIRSRVRHR